MTGFLTYERDGAVFHGKVDDPDGGGPITELGTGDLLELLESGDLDSAASRTGPELDRADVSVVAPIRRPPKLLAVAANYGDHVREAGGRVLDPRRATPRLFLKPSSSIIGTGTPVRLPSFSTTVDWEIELGVVIGQRCRNVTVDEALGVVAGYMTTNDVSARKLTFDFEREEQDVKPFFDWLAGKWADGFAPMGPCIVPASEVPDPQNLDMTLTVNGDVYQDNSTSEMLFGVAELISYASSFMSLEPGDIFETGTPSGCGSATGRFLEPGDVMVARVGKLGTLTTPVVAGSE